MPLDGNGVDDEALLSPTIAAHRLHEDDAHDAATQPDHSAV